MKDLFLALSAYNKKTNEIIYSLIENLSESDFEDSLKCYYKNIGENLIHVIRSDIKWLQRLSAYTLNEKHREIVGIINNSDSVTGKVIVKHFDEISELRRAFDIQICNLIKKTPESEFVKITTMAFGNQVLKLELWKLLSQWFNHQTHHRGQLSLQLENVGIENDYSLILDKI